MTAVPVFMMASLLLAMASFLLWASVGGRRRAQRQRPRMHQSLSEYARDSLQAAGINVDGRAVFISSIVLATAGIILFLLLDTWKVPLSILLLLLMANALFRLRVSRLRRGIKVQMPGFLDQLNRDLAAGQGLDISFRRAVLRLEKPLRPVMERVLNRVNMGQEIDVCIQHEAELLKSFELELLATIISVNLKHGGSVKNALDSYINMLRLDERNKTELRAMTGETRVTAWVMGLVPVAVLGLMFVTNRSFLDSMLTSQGGQSALMIAIGLQLIGAVALYRMLRFK